MPEDRTVAFQIGRYLDLEIAPHRAGEISVSEFSNARAGLTNFRDWLGPQSQVEKINAEKWEEYYLHLLAQAKRSTTTRRKHFRYARGLVTWVSDKGLIASLPNLLRRYRFKGGTSAIQTIPIK